MNDSPIEPTEEQLTAFALDELAADERAAVEVAIERDPIFRAKLEEIRSAVGAVEAAYATEAAYASEAAAVLSDTQREEVIAKAEDAKPGPWTLRPVFMRGLAAAAVILVAAAILLPATFRAREAYRSPSASLAALPDIGVAEQSSSHALLPELEAEEWRYEQSQTETLREVGTDPDGNRIVVVGGQTGAESGESQSERLERMAASGYSVVMNIQSEESQPLSEVDRPAEPNHASEQPNAGAGSLTQQEKEELRAIGYIVDGEGGSAVVPNSESKPKAKRPVSRTAFKSRARLQPSTRPLSQEEQEALRAIGYTLPAPNEQVARQIQESLGTGNGRNAHESDGFGIAGNQAVSAPTSIASAGAGATADFSRNENRDQHGSAAVPLLGDIPSIEREVLFLRDATEFGTSNDRFQVAGTPENRRLWRDPNWAWNGRSAPTPPAITPGTEAYQYFVENTFKSVTQAPLSTFSIDVDTAAYANVRRFLTNNQVPPKDAVRIEELINYFDYDYAAPSDDSEHPFAAQMKVASAPWNPQHKLVQVGIKGKEVERGEQPPSNLVFLLDVSGSMKQSNKLPLVKQAIGLLARQLRSVDRVAIVVYAGNSGMVLKSTPGDHKDEILGALDRLQAGGSTNGGAGIQLAYNVAKQNLIPGGVNRVILATDGDFNVGVTNQGDLIRLVEERAKGGIFLTALGFGMGNLKDDTLEMLSNKGNGNYAYVDSFAEARKVFVDELNGTLVTIAKDVKIQVEFNPAKVARYRLIGYENRALAARDFNDDTKDAGEIGAGHTVTALYEIVPVGAEAAARSNVDALKYQSAPQAANRAEEVSRLIESHVNTELLTLKLRYKQPEGTTSTLMEYPLSDEGEAFAQADGELQFATAVAAFGMKLRGSPHAGNTSWQDVLGWAENSLGRDPHGYRNEFLGLVRAAQRLMPDVRNLQTSIDPDTLSGIRLLNIQKAGGNYMAQIQVGRSKMWYKEGTQFFTYTLLSIDTDTGCVAVFSEALNRPIEVCFEPDRP